MFAIESQCKYYNKPKLDLCKDLKLKIFMINPSKHPDTLNLQKTSTPEPIDALSKNRYIKARNEMDRNTQMGKFPSNSYQQPSYPQNYGYSFNTSAISTYNQQNGSLYNPNYSIYPPQPPPQPPSLSSLPPQNNISKSVDSSDDDNEDAGEEV